MSKFYGLCNYIANAAKRAIEYIEDGQYRNAITTLESMRDWAVREQIKEYRRRVGCRISIWWFLV